jgi:hypothetical protein
MNVCRDCGHHFYPRGHAISARCPNCRSPRVRQSYAGLVVLAVIVTMCLWFGSRGGNSSSDTQAPSNAGAAAAARRKKSRDVKAQHEDDAGVLEPACGRMSAFLGRASRPDWSQWICRRRRDVPAWDECLRARQYTSDPSRGCPGATRCCPPEGGERDALPVQEVAPAGTLEEAASAREGPGEAPRSDRRHGLVSRTLRLPLAQISVTRARPLTRVARPCCFPPGSRRLGLCRSPHDPLNTHRSASSSEGAPCGLGARCGCVHPGGEDEGRANRGAALDAAPTTRPAWPGVPRRRRAGPPPHHLLGARARRPRARARDPRARRGHPPRPAAALRRLPPRPPWNAVTATDARSSRPPSARASSSSTTSSRRSSGAGAAPRQPLHRRRRGPRQDHRGRPRPPRAAAPPARRVQVLIVCPASVTLQWRDEMQKKFGLQFEIYDRPFVARRRQERGFGVNPWSTHTRFIISYQTLRRPEYRDPLLAHIGERARKSCSSSTRPTPPRPASPRATPSTRASRR